MTALDWSVIILYIAAMLGLSYYLGKKQKNESDYYVGGRNMSWWAIGISTMATQTSAISFLSIPAFVALKPGGGMIWLQWELAVPLAMIVLATILLPVFRHLKLISVYEYLEMRYDARVRRFMSGVFLVSRGLATGVVLYAASLVLSVILGLPVIYTLLIIGIVIAIYDTLGGMEAVVYSDVIQMVILLAGLVICIAVATSEVGGFTAAIDALPEQRWQALDMHGDSPVPFWSVLIGGFFLYLSYYGTDQSQVQRQLSARSLADVRRSAIFNGLARFPLIGLYAILGIAAGALYHSSPELQGALADKPLDYLIPELLMRYVPEGIRAIIIAAVLAAAMSSIDSAVNSLSAATMRDYIEPLKPDMDEKARLWTGRLTTIFWSLITTGFALIVSDISDTVVEAINKIGSAFYGSILAAFLAGLLTVRAQAMGVIVGVIAGAATNIYLWQFHPEIHWTWWNVIGFAITFSIAWGSGLSKPISDNARAYSLQGLRDAVTWGEGSKAWYLILAGYFIAILALLAYLS